MSSTAALWALNKCTNNENQDVKNEILTLSNSGRGAGTNLG